MARFLLGVLLGAVSSGITYAVTESLGWTALVGAVVVVLVWFGQFILDDLL